MAGSVYQKVVNWASYKQAGPSYGGLISVLHEEKHSRGSDEPGSDCSAAPDLALTRVRLHARQKRGRPRNRPFASLLGWIRRRN